MARQDDTPQQNPTPGGSAKTEQNRPAPGTGDGLSDASETIVSGDHVAGTGAAKAGAATAGEEKTSAPTDGAATDGAAAAGAGTNGAPAADADDDGINHDDWDAAFADAAGTPAASETPANAEPRRSAAVTDDDVVPGGHPSLAQRSSLPMRRASTMPNLSGYGELSEEERKQAGDINAEPPTGSHAVDASEAAPATTAAATSPDAQASAGDTAPFAAAAGAAAGAVAGSGSAASGGAAASAAASPKTESLQTAPISTSAVSAPSAAESRRNSSEADPAAAPSGPEGAEDRMVDDEISEEEARRRAEERERAGAAKPVLARILQVMVAVFFPVMLLAAAVRAVATPLFLWVEYHRPGFPSDSYGFSTDDRMTYGSYAVDYLLNFSGARYLGDLVTAGGEPLYLESEVSHMADVKTVLTIAFVSALVMAVLSLFACVYLAKRSPGGIRRALFSGAVLTLVLVGALIVTAVLGWETFFTQVHSIFFANGNWTFRVDDTLIRLFPAQFWMDAGIAIAALVLLTCIVVLICAWPTKARRQRARAKQEAARRRYLDSLEAV